MSCSLVLIADPNRSPLEASLVTAIAERFNAVPRWLAEAEAVDMAIDGHDPASVKAVAGDMITAWDKPLDVAVVPTKSRKKRLLISDMDSTMITVECIDELADFAGVKDEVAAITARAMQGELNFEGALHERVALLSGLSVDIIDQVYVERVRAMPGAHTLVQTMRRLGAVTALVSGGFVPFAERVARDLGFETVVANRLEVADGRLTGRVLPPICGPEAKLSTLTQLMRSHDLGPDETLALGDGANDLPMIRAAGLGVAFRPHRRLADESDVVIQAGDLTAVLYLQGVSTEQFFVK